MRPTIQPKYYCLERITMTTEELFIQEYRKIDKAYRKALKKGNTKAFRKLDRYILIPSTVDIDLPLEMVLALHDVYMQYMRKAKDEIKLSRA